MGERKGNYRVGKCPICKCRRWIWEVNRTNKWRTVICSKNHKWIIERPLWELASEFYAEQLMKELPAMLNRDSPILYILKRM